MLGSCCRVQIRVTTFKRCSHPKRSPKAASPAPVGLGLGLRGSSATVSLRLSFALSISLPRPHERQKTSNAKIGACENPCIFSPCHSSALHNSACKHSSNKGTQLTSRQSMLSVRDLFGHCSSVSINSGSISEVQRSFQKHLMLTGM